MTKVNGYECSARGKELVRGLWEQEKRAVWTQAIDKAIGCYRASFNVPSFGLRCRRQATHNRYVLSRGREKRERVALSRGELGMLRQFCHEKSPLGRKSQRAFCFRWRRRRDSNPRTRERRVNGFRDRRIQPLCHSSVRNEQGALPEKEVRPERLLAESRGFEPRRRFWRLHDFQSCSFGRSDNSP